MTTITMTAREVASSSINLITLAAVALKNGCSVGSGNEPLSLGFWKWACENWDELALEIEASHQAQVADGGYPFMSVYDNDPVANVEYLDC